MKPIALVLACWVGMVLSAIPARCDESPGDGCAAGVLFCTLPPERDSMAKVRARRQYREPGDDARVEHVRLDPAVLAAVLARPSVSIRVQAFGHLMQVPRLDLVSRTKGAGTAYASPARTAAPYASLSIARRPGQAGLPGLSVALSARFDGMELEVFHDRSWLDPRGDLYIARLTIIRRPAWLQAETRRLALAFVEAADRTSWTATIGMRETDAERDAQPIPSCLSARTPPGQRLDLLIAYTDDVFTDDLDRDPALLANRINHATNWLRNALRNAGITAPVCLAASPFEVRLERRGCPPRPAHMSEGDHRLRCHLWAARRHAGLLATRARVHADLIVLICEKKGVSRGRAVAWTETSGPPICHAIAVVPFGRLGDNSLLAHEVGHLLGAGHRSPPPGRRYAGRAEHAHAACHDAHGDDPTYCSVMGDAGVIVPQFSTHGWVEVRPGHAVVLGARGRRNVEVVRESVQQACRWGLRLGEEGCSGPRTPTDRTPSGSRAWKESR